MSGINIKNIGILYRISITLFIGSLILLCAIDFDETCLHRTHIPHQFIDNLDGTIANNRLSRVWVKDIGCVGRLSWTEAISFCDKLSDGICGLTDKSTPGTWHIPTKEEFDSLLDPGNFSPVLPKDHPFIGIKEGCYWLNADIKNGVCKASYKYIGHGGAGLGGINVCMNEYNEHLPAYFYLIPVRYENKF